MDSSNALFGSVVIALGLSTVWACTPPPEKADVQILRLKSLLTKDWETYCGGSLNGKVTVKKNGSPVPVPASGVLPLARDLEITVDASAPSALVINLPDNGWLSLLPGSSILIYYHNVDHESIELKLGSAMYMRNDNLPDASTFAPTTTAFLPAKKRRFKIRNVSTVAEGTGTALRTRQVSGVWNSSVANLEGTVTIYYPDASLVRTLAEGRILQWKGDDFGSPIEFDF